MKGRAVFYQQNLLNFYKYAISDLGRKDLRMNDRKGDGDKTEYKTQIGGKSILL